MFGTTRTYQKKKPFVYRVAHRSYLSTSCPEPGQCVIKRFYYTNKNKVELQGITKFEYLTSVICFE